MNLENKLSQGLVQIYTGDGKGKTTAALGLALRAAGHGLKVEVIQYLKGSTYTGELYSTERLANLNIKQFGKGCSYAALIKQGLMGCTGCGECFIKNSKNKEAHQKFVTWAYEYTKEILEEGKQDLVILDEINNALRYDLLSTEDVLKLIELKSEQTELILTGRRMPQDILEKADLVTEMKAIKHPYQQGIKSRRGIEY
ncbi:cob(I)alamin adenosyltransferase [Orenia metallireducens]|uniref:Cob(I)alamin adenosyltransferase n=1 Tax=Orenia metallireducens TaxID=1413210 RepID=A0A285GNZ1_9FIRM|nr:cob(I)yrinic acid a,c-diamide adenosyltransferase [Orenia metallireducens]PRX29858.1 cob(I)alamin adenosyltransferase [Orenia metallireducens]SNY25350.1 cob(I)alamin adenosyltransferase [Orenia metallireducens]